MVSPAREAARPAASNFTSSKKYELRSNWSVRPSVVRSVGCTGSDDDVRARVCNVVMTECFGGVIFKTFARGKSPVGGGHKNGEARAVHSVPAPLQ